MSRLHLSKLVVATHNPGKKTEMNRLLAPFGVTVLSAGELGLPEPEETGSSFFENAALKARAAAAASGEVSLADDSGLCVTALGGAPGIFSARWGGASKDMKAAMERVIREIGTAEDRSAHFICSLVLAWPDGKVENVEGRVDGHLVWPPRGENGFGYDPIFMPDGETRTFGEMTAEEKDPISHRGRAMKLLLEKFFA